MKQLDINNMTVKDRLMIYEAILQHYNDSVDRKYNSEYTILGLCNAIMLVLWESKIAINSTQILQLFPELKLNERIVKYKHPKHNGSPYGLIDHEGSLPYRIQVLEEAIKKCNKALSTHLFKRLFNKIILKSRKTK